MDSVVLEVRSVACKKDKDTYIFKNVDFTVNEGDIVVIQGESGSGYVPIQPVP